jgi:hypothetical protein
MKPDTRTAMHNLIGQIRAAIPFVLPEAQMCSDSCDGCSIKLLEFLESELQDWERKLDVGKQPNLGDLARLANTGKKIFKILERNGLVQKGR